MKRIYVIVLAALFVVAATTVFAFGPGSGPAGPGGHGPHFGGPMGFGSKLDLSKEQMEKMWQLKEKFHNDTQAVRYELFQKRMELRTLFGDPKATDAAIIAKQKELDTARQKMQDKMVQFKLDQRKILTPEQITKLGDEGRGPGSHRGFGPASGRRGFGPGSCGRQ